MAFGGVDRPPYAGVVRLFYIAQDRWPEIDGQASLNGVDLMSLPIYRFINAIYAWSLERVEDRQKFDDAIFAPIAGRVTDADVEREREAFAAFASGFGGA